MDPKQQASRTATTTRADRDDAVDDAVVRAVGAWVQQFGRTLKNCRLYEPGNATVLRFRQQLVAGLHQVLREQGPFTLRFQASDVTLDGVSLYPAKVREDNLALPFYRDGIRSITFHDGVEPREVDALVAAVLAVTSQDATGDEDLVTLLWESQLTHVAIDYIPAEGDVSDTAASAGEPVPWPTGAAEPAPRLEDPGPRTQQDPPPSENVARSDDWNVGEPTADFEAEFASLNAGADAEVPRFRDEYEAERAMTPVAAAVSVARAFVAAETTDEDRAELAAYLPRLLRAAVQAGAWTEAHTVVALMREAPSGWSPIAFVQEFQQPSSVAAVRTILVEQSEDQVRAFTEFAMDLGDFAVDVLGQTLAELDGAAQSRPIADVIVALCRQTPERLAPWLGDRRPNVVRNVVRMLGTIGGNAIVGPLQAAIRHPDSRIRAEAIHALRTADVRTVKPLLLAVLPQLDPRMFCQALQKLGERRDPQVGQTMLLLMLAPEFEMRTPEEKHTIYTTLGSTGADEVIPELEAELLKGGWFERVNEAHRIAVARCLSRIGTPMARMVLDNGVKSRRQQVREACADAILKWDGARG